MKPTQLGILQKTCREKILQMTTEAGSGHLAGPLGIIDILIYLFHVQMQEEDEFVLSAAHMVPALYAILNSKGIISDGEALTLRKFGSRLQGHTSINRDLKIPTSGGSLGQGIGYAAGMAFANQFLENEGYIYCLISDGEINEGSVYECFLFLNKFKLRNITVILDRNNIQQTGFGSDIMPLPDLEKFFSSFGNLHVLTCNGNNLDELEHAFKQSNPTKPNVIICNTIGGKGIKNMENNPVYHSKVLTREEYNYIMEHQEEWTLS